MKPLAHIIAAPPWQGEGNGRAILFYGRTYCGAELVHPASVNIPQNGSVIYHYGVNPHAAKYYRQHLCRACLAKLPKGITLESFGRKTAPL